MTTPAKTVPKWRGPVILVAKILVALVGVWLVVKALRQIDWAQVGDALGRLRWWEIVVVVLIICVRQSVNASTLVVLIPKLSMVHALSTALSGTLIQTFVPPPADAVLRLSMLRSYGVEPARGAAALVLDTVVFYLARFLAPVVGLIVAVAFVTLPIESAQVWLAIGGAAAAAALFSALVVIARGEKAAGNLGRWAARVVRRLRPKVDPEAWAAALGRFQRESAAGLNGRIGRATPIMLAFIVVDSLVILACLRFVGVPGEHVEYLAVLAALLCLYPLTIFPFAGLGILDAAIIALINADGAADPADLVAALVIWRAATLLLPLLPGLFTLTRWRRQQARAAAVAPAG